MPKQVLFVDDSATMQKVVEIALSGTNYQLTAVKSAEEALHKIRQQRPDLVIAEAGLIGKSGYDLAGLIKADPATQELPFLLLTSYFHPYDEALGQRCGVNAYLSKPFESQVFLDKINEVMSNRKTGSRATELPTNPADWHTPALATNPTLMGVPLPNHLRNFTTTESASAINTAPSMGASSPPLPQEHDGFSGSTVSSIVTKLPVSSALSEPVLSQPIVTPQSTAAPLQSSHPTYQPAVVTPLPQTAPPSAYTIPAPSVANKTSAIATEMPRPPFLARAPIPQSVLEVLQNIANRGKAHEAIAHLSMETIEKIVWEVVPELADVMIKSALQQHLRTKGVSPAG